MWTLRRLAVAVTVASGASGTAKCNDSPRTGRAGNKVMPAAPPLVQASRYWRMRGRKKAGLLVCYTTLAARFGVLPLALATGAVDVQRGIKAFRWSSLLSLRQVALPQRPPNHCPQCLYSDTNRRRGGRHQDAVDALEDAPVDNRTPSTR